ncbi:MAG: hypothetical protein NC548_38740 [Lachnospiraceae bacterium]|nr:hypothetical protein [Lachnospiraceae bacterium]
MYTRQIVCSREFFQNFMATFRQYDGISVLDWRNRNGGIAYSVRYVFDEDKNRFYISGDTGNAVVYNGNNSKELADRYNLTLPQIFNIIKGLPTAGQVDLFSYIQGQNIKD